MLYRLPTALENSKVKFKADFSLAKLSDTTEGAAKQKKKKGVGMLYSWGESF